MPEETNGNEVRVEEKSKSSSSLMMSDDKLKSVNPRNLVIVLSVIAVNIVLLVICMSHISQLMHTLTNSSYSVNVKSYSMTTELICVFCSLFAFAAFVIPWKYKKPAAIVITIAAVAVRILA